MLMLKEARTRKGLEQKQIAEKFGLSISTISLYETGKREPALDTVVKFADFFGVTTDYLLGRTVFQECEDMPEAEPDPAPESPVFEEMVELFQSLTEGQARLLLKAAERILEPVRAKVAE